MYQNLPENHYMFAFRSRSDFRLHAGVTIIHPDAFLIYVKKVNEDSQSSTSHKTTH